MKKFILTIFLGFMTAAGAHASATVTKAIAKVHPAKGQTVTGTVTFTQLKEGVEVMADIEGLTPGKHGFHIHEKGDCSAPDFSSAGGHYNPTHKKHGGPDSPERHVGDLGNLVADKEGKAHYERVDSVIQLNGNESIVNYSVVIHADPDDYVSQPSGNAGSRIGCGIIEAVK